MQEKYTNKAKLFEFVSFAVPDYGYFEKESITEAERKVNDLEAL